MSSYISDTEKAAVVTIFDNIFDTFTQRLVIYKESLKTSNSNNNANFSFGFGESQADEAFTYTEVTGVFPANIRYPSSIQEESYDTDSNVYLPDATVKIKVKRDCRDFINNGKTEKFLIHDRYFILDSEEERKTFLGTEFYTFKLRSIK